LGALLWFRAAMGWAEPRDFSRRMVAKSLPETRQCSSRVLFLL
jgi:hypothetical protein